MNLIFFSCWQYCSWPFVLHHNWINHTLYQWCIINKRIKVWVVRVLLNGFFWRMSLVTFFNQSGLEKLCWPWNLTSWLESCGYPDSLVFVFISTVWFLLENFGILKLSVTCPCGLDLEILFAPWKLNV